MFDAGLTAINEPAAGRHSMKCRMTTKRMEIAMSIQIPASLRAEHESIHARLIEATREPGAVG